MTMAAVRGDDPASLFATPAIVAERRADGSTIVRSTTPLKPAARCVGDWLEHWARVAPDRVFLGERAGEAPWTTVTYRDALRQVRSIAAWILAQGLSAERPLAVLSDNSVDHALLALGAMHAGVPVAAISPAYSLMSRDFDKLKSMIALLQPGAIYVSATKPYAAALAAIKPLHDARIVSGAADGDEVGGEIARQQHALAQVAAFFAEHLTGAIDGDLGTADGELKLGQRQLRTSGRSQRSASACSALGRGGGLTCRELAEPAAPTVQIDDVSHTGSPIGSCDPSRARERFLAEGTRRTRRYCSPPPPSSSGSSARIDSAVA